MWLPLTRILILALRFRVWRCVWGTPCWSLLPNCLSYFHQPTFISSYSNIFNQLSVFILSWYVKKLRFLTILHAAYNVKMLTQILSCWVLWNSFYLTLICFFVSFLSQASSLRCYHLAALLPLLSVFWIRFWPLQENGFFKHSRSTLVVAVSLIFNASTSHLRWLIFSSWWDFRISILPPLL